MELSMEKENKKLKWRNMMDTSIKILNKEMEYKFIIWVQKNKKSD